MRTLDGATSTTRTVGAAASGSLGTSCRLVAISIAVIATETATTAIATRALRFIRAAPRRRKLARPLQACACFRLSKRYTVLAQWRKRSDAPTISR